MSKVNTIDEYINSFPEDIQKILNKIRKMGREIIKDGTEEISYGIPTFKLNGKYVFYFAAFKSHISIYPVVTMPEKFMKEIKPYQTGKGTLQFPLNKEIPFPLIEQFIKYALESNLERTKK